MSNTLIGVWVQVIVWIVKFTGIEVAPSAIQTTVETVLLLGSGLWIWYQRVKKGDVKWYGKRK